MSVKKLSPAAAAALALVFTLTAPVTSATASTTSTAAQPRAVTSGAAALAVKRRSIGCIKPKGKKTNYSWANGDASTTVYFNNHCSHRVYATLHFKGPAGTRKECLATNGGTKGKKKFRKGLAENLSNLTKGC